MSTATWTAMSGLGRPGSPTGRGLSGARLRRLVRSVVAAVTFVIAVVLLVVTVGGEPARGQGAPRATIVVEQGDTLEAIALRHMPDVDLKDAEFAIMDANHLPNSRVRAGDVLVIPAP